ncbi:MAG: carboxymuconolactone decarboxylase family protein [Hyphomicrobiaceae bacterium]
MRLDYAKVAPDGYKAMLALYQYLPKTSLDMKLVHLLWLRVSQINGCAYCVDLHARDALQAGVLQRKVNAVVVWHETPFFTESERAALAWAEALTRIVETRAPDSDFEALKQHFSEKEITDLTYAICMMNGLNRLAIGFRKGPAA